MTNCILDLDGTLVNTALATVPACIQAARAMGLPERDPGFIRGLIGLPDPELFRQLYPECGDADRRELDSRVIVLERDIITGLGESFLYPGVLDVLETLRSRGCALALASAATPHHMDLCMAVTGLGPYFPVRRYGSGEKAAMVRDIIAGQPGRWLMAGDRAGDCRAAHGSGIPAAWTAYGFGPESEGALFDFRLDRFGDIADLLT